MGIGQVGQAAGAAATGAAANALGALGGDAFLKLLVAQMRYQNPMQPTDGTAMLQQTAQFTQVETLQALAKTQRELVAYHQASVASPLVGREVTAVDAEGVPFTVTVDHVRFGAEGPVLCAGEREFSLDSVRELSVPGVEHHPSTSTQNA